MNAASPVLPDFDEVAAVLQRFDADVEAAEAHGVFVGAAVLSGPHAGALWIKETLGEPDSADVLGVEAGKLLARVALTTYTMLENGDMAFEPLLPSDDESLYRRTESLAMWCQGFMHGIALGAQGNDAKRVFESDIAKEILADFTEITRAAVDPDAEDSEDGERAFFELVEYIRVSAQLIFDDSKPLRETEKPDTRH